MKKITLSVVLSFIVFGFSSAQQRGFHIGGIGGYNAIGILNRLLPEQAYHITCSPQYGFASGYNFNHYLGLQVELVNSHQGQKAENSSNQIVEEVNLHYLQLPILFQFADGDEFSQFYLTFGPQFGFLKDAQITTPAAGMIQAKDRFEKHETGILLELGTYSGLSHDYAESRSHHLLCWSVGLRFYYGLTDINTPQYRIPIPGKNYQKATNVAAGINIGIHWIIR
ncbi:MAG: PorT family protein [Bacteroidetes bacterium]|nr:PorT family protein [Bacteroidota bacterium]